MLHDTDYVLKKLDWMETQGLWPNGERYLWTDAFGLVLYVSLYEALEDKRWLKAAKHLVSEVDRVLGRKRGYRIGEQPDRDGQYFHYLSMWLYALAQLGKHEKKYRDKAVKVAKDIHAPFLADGHGVWWKMKEDLSGPYPGFGLGALDPFDGLVAYRIVDPQALEDEVADMERLVERYWPEMRVTQDLGIGILLWCAHFYPDEAWAKALKRRCLSTLETMWIEPEGYVCREPDLADLKFAFTNYGVSLGLQAIDAWPERVERINAFFETWRHNDEYDRNPITHVMACTSHFPGLFIPERFKMKMGA